MFRSIASLAFLIPSLAAAAVPRGLIPGGVPLEDVICVTTPTELGTALLYTMADGLANEIRVAAGTYPALSIFVNDQKSLLLSGGWIEENGVPCARQLPAADLTVFDAQAKNHAALLTTSTPSPDAQELTLANLSIRNGTSPVTSADQIGGAGLALVYSDPAFAGRTRIVNVILGGNRTIGIGGAITLFGPHSGEVTLDNVLARDNSASRGAGFWTDMSNVAITVRQSTFTLNVCSWAPPRGCSIDAMGNGAAIDIANSLFWSNSDADVGALGPASLAVRDSDVDTFAQGTVPTVSANLLHASPGFNVLGGPLIAADSALANAANPAAAVSAYDLAGNLRTIGAAPDIGAYETDLLFRAGND